MSEEGTFDFHLICPIRSVNTCCDIQGANGSIQLDRGVVADDVLLVLVEQIVENLFVKEGDSFEVVTRSWLETDDLVDEAVGLVAEIRDVLLTLYLLLNVGRIVTDLQFDSIKRRRINLL